MESKLSRKSSANMLQSNDQNLEVIAEDPPVRCRRLLKGCLVQFKTSQIINRKTEFNGCHEDEQFDAITFNRSNLLQIPSSRNILAHMPHLKKLSILRSSISKISKFDLRGFECLTSLAIRFCNIEEVPGNLFDFTPNLSCVHMDFNKIKFVGRELLEPLRDLSFFDFTGNVGLDVKFDARNRKGMSLQQFKEELGKYEKKEPATPRSARKILRDFTLKVNGKEFKVNKQTFMAKSSTIARMIALNPEAETLELEHASESVVRVIANYLNRGSEPDPNVSAMELYGACYKLGMDELASVAYDMMVDKISPHTALDVLLFCNKFHVNDSELKMKAFEEFKKNFPPPFAPLTPSMASNPEKLKQLMKAKENMEVLAAGGSSKE